MASSLNIAIYLFIRTFVRVKEIPWSLHVSQTPLGDLWGPYFPQKAILSSPFLSQANPLREDSLKSKQESSAEPACKNSGEGPLTLDRDQRLHIQKREAVHSAALPS